MPTNISSSSSTSSNNDTRKKPSPSKPSPSPSTSQSEETGSSANSVTGSKDAAKTDTIQDKSELSSESLEKSKTEEEKTFQTHLDAVERNFENIDDKGDDGTDGEISDGDIEAVAEGDYDEEQVRDRLEARGLTGDELEEEIGKLESAASYFHEDESAFDRLESAGSDEGDTDDKLTQKDVDVLQLESQREMSDAREQDLKNGLDPDAPERRDVVEAYKKFDSAGELNRALRRDSNLSNYTDAEVAALSHISSTDRASHSKISQALEGTIEEADSLDDLQGTGFRGLINQNVLAGDKVLDQTSADKLKQLTEEKVESVIDGRLADRKGDAATELAGDRITEDLRELALNNLSVASYIDEAAQARGEDIGARLEDIQRADDNIFQKAGNLLKDGASLVGDGIRGVVDLATKLPGPASIIGAPLKLGSTAVGAVGDVAAKGLDAVGAGGVADVVRDGSNLLAKGLSAPVDFAEEQLDNLTRGLAEGAAGAVEGIAQTIANPVDTVKGFVEMAKDPLSYFDGYIETAKEHGVAGAVGHVAFDFLGTKGLGGAAGAVSKTASFEKLSELAGSNKLVTGGLEGAGLLATKIEGAKNSFVGGGLENAGEFAGVESLRRRGAEMKSRGEPARLRDQAGYLLEKAESASGYSKIEEEPGYEYRDQLNALLGLVG